jgi:hypothetical protein
LGAATARLLTARGARVGIFDMNEELAAQVAAEIGGAYAKVDVTNEAEVDAGFAKVRAQLGQERILVNCAGIGNAYKTAWRDKQTGVIKSFPTADFEKIIQVNLIGTFRCIAKSAAGMLTLEAIDGERGAISSVAPDEAQGRGPRLGERALQSHEVGGGTQQRRDPHHCPRLGAIGVGRHHRRGTVQGAADVGMAARILLAEPDAGPSHLEVTTGAKPMDDAPEQGRSGRRRELERSIAFVDAGALQDRQHPRGRARDESIAEVDRRRGDPDDRGRDAAR